MLTSPTPGTWTRCKMFIEALKTDFVGYFFVVKMLLGNKPCINGKPFYILLNGATFVKNMHLWDGQQS